MEGKHHQRKVQRSGPASGQIGAGCSNSSCNDNHQTTDQVRTTTGAVGVPDAAINTTCVRAHNITSTCPNACYIDCCIRCWWCFPSSSWRKYSTCTCGGYHPLQLVLVVFFSSNHWRKYSTCTHATCTVWWWLQVVVV